MAILAHAPSLQVVEFRDCVWDMHKPQTNYDIALRHLQRLRVTSSSFQRGASFDPSRWFFEHIQAPVTVILQLTHHLQYDDPTENGKYLGRLQRIIAERLWPTDAFLSFGVEQLSVTLDVFEESRSNQIAQQQVKLEIPQISFAFIALELMDTTDSIAHRIRLLSLWCDKEMWMGTQELDTLGRCLRHIEFLHIKAPAYEHEQPLGLFPRLADTVDDAILFPQLRRLMIIPARLPRGTLRLDAIAELLRRRASHRENQLQHAHLDVPRPGKKSKDALHAVAIEETVDVVVWRSG